MPETGCASYEFWNLEKKNTEYALLRWVNLHYILAEKRMELINTLQNFFTLKKIWIF